MKFRKKPVVIEAMQFDGDNGHLILSWMHGPGLHSPISGERELKILTLEGEMTAAVGDWIICGVKGEFYPCKPDIFEATYEPVAALKEKSA